MPAQYLFLDNDYPQVLTWRDQVDVRLEAIASTERKFSGLGNAELALSLQADIENDINL